MADPRDQNSEYYYKLGFGNDQVDLAGQQPQTSPYYGGDPVQMKRMNQTQTQPHQPHGGGYVPQQEQPRLDRRHGGGFIPEPQEQPHLDRRHGGGFIPEPEQERHSDRTYSGPHTPNQQAQGQGQRISQGAGSKPQDKFGAESRVTTTSSGPASDAVPKVESFASGESRTDQYVVPRKHQKGYRNLQNERNQWRWKYPHAYQMPGFRFGSSQDIRHRDCLQRVLNAPEEDRYLSPTDGHLAKLVVQVTDDVYNAQAKSTWRRTFVRNVSSPVLRVANWAINSVPLDPTTWTFNDWLLVCGKWLLASLALMFLMPLPSSVNGEVRNQGFYDRFPYRFWGYAKYWRNHRENETRNNSGDEEFRRAPRRKENQEIGLGKDGAYDHEESTNPVDERLLRPRYLCFLDQGRDQSPSSAVPMKVKDWLAQKQLPVHPDYLFVAYTAEQFQSEKDLQALARLAEKATRDAGLSAYWIGSSCMPDPDEMEEDVYRISDVIRGAKGLTIAVGHPVNRRTEEFTTEELLMQWGRRMWTLPEALLSPKGNSIKVYTRSFDDSWEILKASFAGVVWQDAPWTRQLMDHYEGSLILSPLELVVLALRCLSNRDVDRQTYFPGDLAYVLMGLLRRRPRANRSDSAFQAFARLSLANDSDMLLERLVCVHPKSPNQRWLSTDDAWDAQLWDIYPSIQVAGVGQDDTVILDGAYGAAIRWKSFAPVAYTVGVSWKRSLSNTLFRSSPLVLVTAITLLSLRITAAGAVLLIISLVTLLASPYLVRVQYGGKLWGTQPWFFGFEGHLDIETIESNIFGAYLGRLTWSPSGSPLSRHHSNRYGECVGLDPTSDPEVRRLVEKARKSEFGEEKIFTLVDTSTMTVTMFSAVRPPIAALLCGSEGGMQRAVMCSYDAQTQTLYRETVLRMETGILQTMFRVGRFRFGFRRPSAQTQPRA